MTLKDATYEIVATGGHPVVTRTLEFKNGDSIALKVTVPNGENLSLVDLHKASAQKVIELLQDWLKP